MKKIIPQSFFAKPTLKVAKNLLGKFLVRQIDGRQIAGKITEVEAYIGEEDKACHASRGKTRRNEILYKEAGTIYVYFTYGMHWLVNIVTEEKDFPSAVLIRGIEIENIPIKKTNGPAKITKLLGINGELNGKKALKKNSMWFEDRGIKVSPQKIQTSKRIGVDYAGDWAEKPWRFFLAD